MHPSATIAMSAIIMAIACAETSTDSYTEDGKTYHQPAVITTGELDGYESYSETEKKLTSTALAAIPTEKWLKYKFGGASPEAGGFDCSGAIYYTLHKAGYLPPRSSARQFTWIQNKGNLHKVPKSVTKVDDPTLKHLKPGDLLFWSGTYSPDDGRTVNITHVAMYLGKEKDGRHVMAGSTKGRSYRGKRGDGFGVYEFKLPRNGSRSQFIGYGTPPAPEK